MAPHFTDCELDFAFELARGGATPTEIHKRIKLERGKKGLTAPNLTTVRRALRGVTHKRGLKETRGAKVKLTLRQLRRLDSARKELIQKAAGEGEVHVKDIMAKARLNHVCASTVSKAPKKICVSWRSPREAPLRRAADEAERARICARWRHLPNDYFTDKLDAIIDNKKFDIPVHPRARQYFKMKKVRGHLRTRAEGVKRHFTKPKSNKNRVNPGAAVNVCAAIINCKVKMWQYLPSKWCGDAAVELYTGPLVAALRKHRGAKASCAPAKESVDAYKLRLKRSLWQYRKALSRRPWRR